MQAHGAAVSRLVHHWNGNKADHTERLGNIEAA
jgi:hypothetical protein